MLSAISFRAFQNVGSERKSASLRPQTLAQVSLVSSYMNKILKTRAGAYIICKYVIAHVSKLRQNFETGTDVLDLLLFAPNSESRLQMRQTGVGKAFRDMRYNLASNTLYNCCKYAEAVSRDNQAILEALLDENREHEVSEEFTKEGLDAHDAFFGAGNMDETWIHYKRGRV